MAPTAQPKAPPSRAPQPGSTPAAKAAPKGTSTRGRCPLPPLAAHCLAIGWAAPADTPAPIAQQQLAFLEGRKKQLLQAALRAKQKNDMEGAKMHLRQAKGLEPMLEASRNGLPVDIAKVNPLGLLDLPRISPIRLWPLSSHVTWNILGCRLCCYNK